MSNSPWIALTLLLASGCQSPPPSPPATPPPYPEVAAPADTASKPLAAATEPRTRHAAHRLFVEATACWMGGVWSDALGLPESQWTSDTERRCHAVVRQVHGTDDQEHYERLRALDRTEVAAVKDKVSALAEQDSVDFELQSVLVELVPAVADAERETMFARRAADKVKKDMTGVRTRSKFTSDEMAAIEPMRTDVALKALLDLDAAQLTAEARAIAILCALDRTGTARWLPKHIKVYAVEGPFEVLFGADAPEVSANATKPLPGGVWLAYLKRAAIAAGHPVPAYAKSLEDQELMAWGGVILGLADKLGSQAERISDDTELKRVAQATVQRVEEKYRASEHAVVADSGE